MLNFCHLKLSDSDKTISRSNLVPKTKTYLSCSKRDPTTIKLNQFIEINKHALSSFGSKVTYEIGGRSNLCLEHEVEWLSFGESIASVRRLDFILLEYFIEFLFCETIYVDEDLLEFLDLVCL